MNAGGVPTRCAGAKPVIRMLAAHEPRDDPRVDWAARLASEYFDTAVVGLQRCATPSESESSRPYRVVRCAARIRPSAEFVGSLVDHATSFLSAESARRIARISGFRAAAGNGVARALLVPPIFVLTALGVLIAMFAEVGARTLIGIGKGMAWIARRIQPRTVLQIVERLATRARAASAAEPDRANTVGGRVAWFVIRARARWRENRMFHQLRIFKWTWIHVLASAEVFWSYLEECDERIDVIYCHDLDTLLVGVLYRARNPHVRLIYDSHEYWPYSNVEAMRLHVALFSSYERCLIRRVNHVLTVSGPLAREMEAVYGIENVVVVPNAEVWREIAPPDADSNPIRRLAGTRVSFLFQGSFAPERGLEELIGAWTDVDGQQAALFLRGPDNTWKAALRELAATQGLLNSSVYFLDAVDVDDLTPAAAEADVGIIPYRADLPAYRFACPNKLSQYLHAGLAVLSNDIAYVRDILEDGRCGVTYDATDRASIVRAVNELSGSRERLAEYQRNAGVHGREVFNWDVQSRGLEQIFQRTAEDSARARA